MKHNWILLTCLGLGIAQLAGGEDVAVPVPGADPAATAPGPQAAAPGPEESEDPVMDITTVTGKVYRNATVERVTPSGIDIGYPRADGTYAMIGLPLSSLTPELQKQFGFDAEKARQFDAKVQAAAAQPLDEAAESEAARMARVIQEVKAKLAGADIRIQPADLRFAIYAYRRPVVVVPVERVLSGTVVAIVEDDSTLPKLTPPLVLIDRLELAEGTGKWSGFLYPTGMHARYRDLDKIPVFSDTLDNAQVLLDRYLDIYSEFATAQKDNPAAVATATTTAAAATATGNQAPDQAVQNGSDGSGVAGVDNKGGNVPNNGASDNIGTNYNYYDYPYYIGGSYSPVVWWSSNCWNNNRPWPGPPRPPRPPHPPEPGPGPRPDPGPRPQPQPQPRPQPIGPDVRPQPIGPDVRPQNPTPGFGYRTERNGGFRRMVPSLSPAAHPTTWSGTPAPYNPPRMDRGGFEGGGFEGGGRRR